MESKERLYSIDILKFILAILIAIWHLNQMFGVVFPLSKIIFEQIRLDGIVDTFFIISGFLCLYNYKEQDFDSYIKKKVKKLYPLAVISVVVAIILVFIYKIIYNVDIFGIKLGFWKIFNSLLITHTGGATVFDAAINNPLWYISVLMICYALFWIIIKNKNENTKYLFLLACLIGLGIHEYKINLPFINIYTGRGSAGFFLGCYVCYLYMNNKDSINDTKLLIISTLLLVIITGLLAYDYSYFIDNKWCVDTFIVSPLIIIIFISLNKYVKNIKGISILSNLSYNIYVWHDIILILYGFFNKGLCSFLDMIIYIFIVIFYAIFSHFIIEKKLDKLFINK